MVSLPRVNNNPIGKYSVALLNGQFTVAVIVFYLIYKVTMESLQYSCNRPET